LKKYILILAAIVIILCGLENCRKDAKIVPAPKYTDADSLYTSTPYNFYGAYNGAVKTEFPQARQPRVDSLTVEGIQLGRMLFYDKHLSNDGNMACASCHKLPHGLGDTVVFNTTDFGTADKRNTPPLQNLAWAPYFFWDGRQPTAAAQAQDAAQHELNMNPQAAIAYLQSDSTYARYFRHAFGRPGTITTTNIYRGIEEFVLSAVSINSPFDQYLRGNTTAVAPDVVDFYYNYFLTQTGDCFHCHGQGQNFLFTDYGYKNNGLDSTATIYDFKDLGRGGISGLTKEYGTFVTPSLRNVAVSAPYMHDGRFKTLMDVANFYSDNLQKSVNMDPNIALHFAKDSSGNIVQHGGLHFSTAQKLEMIDFLNSLTDTTFLNNPNLTNPFH
jgi:cytochrome c peroxidase